MGNDDDVDWDTPAEVDADAEVEVDADADGGYCEAEIKDEDEDDGHLLEESGIDEEEDEEEEEGQKVNDEDDEGSEDNAMDVEAVAEGHKSIGQKRKRLAPQDSPVPHHQQRQQHQQRQRQRQQDRHKKTHHRKNNELRIGCSQRSNGAGTLEQQLSQQRGQRARLIAAAISDPWFCPSHCCVGCSALQQTTCTLSAADLPLSYFQGMLDGSNTTAAAVFDGDKATMSGTTAANTASGYSDSRRGDDSQCGTHLNSYFPSTTIVRPADARDADAARGVHGAAGSTSANSDSASNGMGNSASTSTGAKAMSRALARLGVSAPAPAAASFASTSVTTAAAFIAGGTTNGDIMDSTVRRSTRKQQQQTRGLLMNGIGEPQSSYIPAGSVLQQKPLKMCSFCSFSVCRDCEVQLRPPGKGQALLISKRSTPVSSANICLSSFSLSLSLSLSLSPTFSIIQLPNLLQFDDAI